MLRLSIVHMPQVHNGRAAFVGLAIVVRLLEPRHRMSDGNERASTMSGFVEVARKSQIPENGVIGVQAQGKALALVRVAGNIYALDDRCPHEAAPLSDGQIEGNEIVCPWHSSRFDVKTGRVTMDPAMEDIATYKVRVVGDAVEVEL
jgi:nitrite reductase/ring-hydroxylating ferredoxin subunit